MAGVVTNLKNFFSTSSRNKLPGAEVSFSSFRQFHFLNTLDPQSLTDLLQFSEQRFFADLSPDLLDKKGLFFSIVATRLLLERLLKKNPSHLVNYQLEPFTPPRHAAVVSLVGNFKPLALRPYFFDVLFAPFSSFHKKEFLSMMPQFANLLVNGGRAVFSFIHPALEYFLYNQNPSSPISSSNNLQNYFSSFKENNLYIEHLQEGVIDKELKPFFHNLGQSDTFDEYRGIPLVLFFRVVKYIK